MGSRCWCYQCLFRVVWLSIRFLSSFYSFLIGLIGIAHLPLPISGVMDVEISVLISHSLLGLEQILCSILSNP